jgi:hypothetical protein
MTQLMTNVAAPAGALAAGQPPVVVWSPFLTALVALVAVIVSGLTAWLTYWNGKCQIMYPIRSQWIELLREGVARYLDGLHEYITAYSNFQAQYLMHRDEDKCPEHVLRLGAQVEDIFTQLSRLQNRVELLLDLSVPSHAALNDEISRYGKIIFAIAGQYADDRPEKGQALAANLGAHIKNVTDRASEVVTREWNTITGMDRSKRPRTTPLPYR